MCNSLYRLVEATYELVYSNKVNVFDQVCINSFLHRPHAADRLLMVKL